jgi:hypothetical protein
VLDDEEWQGMTVAIDVRAQCPLTANDEQLWPGFEKVDTTVQAAAPHYGVYDLIDVGSVGSANRVSGGVAGG